MYSTEQLNKLCAEHLSVSTDRVKQIDKYLMKEWSVHCISLEDEFFLDFINKKQNAEAYERYVKLIDSRISKSGGNIDLETDEETKAFYSSLCKKPFGSWCMSARRAHVLSGLVAVDSVVSLVKPKSILEFGSGFGFASHWCASRHAVPCHGFDFSEDVVSYAKGAVKKPTGATFETADFFKYKPSCTYDFVFGIAGLPRRPTPGDLKLVSEWVTDGGLVLIISPTSIGGILEVSGRNDDLHVIYDGASGGYLGWGGPGDYQTQRVTLLIKGPPPDGLIPNITDVYNTWGDFANLVNNFPVPDRERNFAFYNSWGRPIKYPVL